jgi:hypothetical protein
MRRGTLAQCTTGDLARAPGEPAGVVCPEMHAVLPEYDVESIIAEKHCRGKILYLIKWLNYGPEDNSWVSYEHIKHAYVRVNDVKKSTVASFEKVRERGKKDVFKSMQDNAKASVSIMQNLCMAIDRKAKKAPSHESTAAFPNCLYKGQLRKAKTGCDKYRFRSFKPPRHYLKKLTDGWAFACGSDLFEWATDNGVILSRRDVGEQREARVLISQFHGTYNVLQVSYT